MPSLSDLTAKRPVKPQSGSLDEYQRQMAFWDLHIEPEIVALTEIVSNKPMREDFDDDDDFEESWHFWMGRQGRGVGMRLSRALDIWGSFLKP